MKLKAFVHQSALLRKSKDKSISDKGLVARIYKHLLHLKMKRQITHVKIGKRFRKVFLQKRYTNGQ